MNPSQPLVSIVIPVYNCEKYLVQAIDSALSQSYKFTELIVVDDGSTDNSGTIAQQYSSQIKYVYQPNRGAGSARNLGLEIACGDYFAFLDADDIWMPNKLSLQMRLFEENPDLNIVFGHVQQFYTPGLAEHIRNKIRCPKEPMPGHIPSAMLVDRASFERVGLFPTNLEIADFADWYARAVELNLSMVTFPEVLTYRRIHANNMGIRKRQHFSTRLHVLKASLDRRRKSKHLSDYVEAEES
jgi:glycosyltransferase involved in cell wall biosynthesis